MPPQPRARSAQGTGPARPEIPSDVPSAAGRRRPRPRPRPPVCADQKGASTMFFLLHGVHLAWPSRSCSSPPWWRSACSSAAGAGPGFRKTAAARALVTARPAGAGPAPAGLARNGCPEAGRPPPITGTTKSSAIMAPVRRPLGGDQVPVPAERRLRRAPLGLEVDVYQTEPPVEALGPLEVGPEGPDYPRYPRGRHTSLGDWHLTFRLFPLPVG